MNKEYTEKYAVNPGTSLKVFNNTGEVIISSWDRDYIEVETIIKRNLWNSFLQMPEIKITEGHEFVICTLYSSGFSRAMIPVHFRIMVPKGVQVAHLETSTGKISVNDVSGNLDVKASTGDIQIRNVAGLVSAETGTGKITVDEVSGDVNAQASIGDIKISNIKGFAKALTKTGKISITRAAGVSGARTSTGNIVAEVPVIGENQEIRTSTGNITLFLAPDITARLEASTSNGNITYNDLAITLIEFSGKKLVGQMGSGSNILIIKTSTGSITLKKLGD